MKTTTFLLLFSCFIINASEHPVTIIELDEIQHTVSRDTSEVNNDSFCISVISFHEAEEPSNESSQETNRHDLNQ